MPCESRGLKNYYMKFKLLLVMTAIMCTLSGCGKNGNGGGAVLPVADYEKLIEENADVVLLDVRTAEEFAEGHIPHAMNVDVSSENFVSTVESKIPKEKEVALYCRSGHRSVEAANKLREAGYKVVDLEGGILAWEKAFLPVTNDTVDVYFTKNGKKIEIQALIHSAVRIVYDGKEIEVDPVHELDKRTTDYSKFPKADLILVTHEHHDHLDPVAIKTLQKSDTLVILNPNSQAILGYGKAMKNGDSLSLGDGMEIEAVPAYNTTPERLQFHPKGRDNGYVLTLDGFRIYIAGDTEVVPEMKNIKDVDVAFFPCNLPYTMTPEQLIEAAKIVMPKVVYPYHYGTTDLSSITPALAPLGIYVRILPFDP